MFCAPSRDGKNKGTCYSKDDLTILVKLYNRHHPENKIKLSTKKDLWEELHSRLRKECTTEWCWLQQNFVPPPYSRTLQTNFKPQMPTEWKKNPYTWLNTLDIKNVMKQYELRYPSFLFIGPVSSDCPSKITCSLSGLDVTVLMKELKKTKLGVIYNLDTHNKPGSHWVSVFSNFLEPSVIYFDSVGLPPPKMIKSFLFMLKRSIEDYWLNVKKKKKTVDVLYNRTKFQFGSSECGVFSINFILDNLKGEALQELGKEHFNDRRMNNLRKVLYRPT